VDENHTVSPMHADTKATVTLNMRTDTYETLKMGTLEASTVKVQPSLNKNFHPTSTE